MRTFTDIPTLRSLSTIGLATLVIRKEFELTHNQFKSQQEKLMEHLKAPDVYTRKS